MTIEILSKATEIKRKALELKSYDDIIDQIHQLAIDISQEIVEVRHAGQRMEDALYRKKDIIDKSERDKNKLASQIDDFEEDIEKLNNTISQLRLEKIELTNEIIKLETK